MTAPATGVPPAYLALRADAQRVLAAWNAPDPAQERLRGELLAHCTEHPDAMSKQGPPAHLTASALVLNASLDKVLLTLHAKAGLWLQFGGHFEPGDESVLCAATREAREESGIPGLGCTRNWSTSTGTCCWRQVSDGAASTSTCVTPASPTTTTRMP